MTILVFVIGLNVYLFAAAPKGFFPQQDTGQINGGMRADQSISFQAMQGKLRQLVDIIKDDPAVATVVGFTGGGTGRGRLHVHRPETGLAAHGQGPGRDRPPASAAGQGDGHLAVPQSRAGSAHGRALQQFHLPVHPDQRQPGGPEEMGGETGRPDEAAAGPDRRGHGPGGKRRGNLRVHRQGPRHAAGRASQGYRQCAVQQLRPAPGGDHLR